MTAIQNGSFPPESIELFVPINAHESKMYSANAILKRFKSKCAFADELYDVLVGGSDDEINCAKSLPSPTRKRNVRCQSEMVPLIDMLLFKTTRDELTMRNKRTAYGHQNVNQSH